jgi:anaerobic magnesium-protoporphyrin IX monomethyl ester cyclase
MARWVRDIAPDAARIFGGPHVNVLPEQTCRHPLVSFASAGPGQFIIPQIINALLNKTTLQNIPGVWTKDANGIVQPAQPFSKQWQTDGLQHWQDIDASPYIKSDDLLGKRTLNYISTFGCCYRCRFCYEQQYGQRYHAIGADKSIADVLGLSSRYHLTGIKFHDADFFVDVQRAERIYTALAREQSPLAWAASIHPNDILRLLQKDSDAMKRMADFGCRRLLMGVESGDPRVLRHVVQKMATVEQIVQSAKAIDAAGIRGAYTFIIGFPGETSEEKQHTIDLAMQLANLPTSPEVRFHGFAPYPGTPIYEDALADGFNQPQDLEEWSAFDYYNMQSPWLTDGDSAFISDWSKVTRRRLVERRVKN